MFKQYRKKKDSYSAETQRRASAKLKNLLCIRLVFTWAKLPYGGERRGVIAHADEQKQMRQCRALYHIPHLYPFHVTMTP